MLTDFSSLLNNLIEQKSEQQNLKNLFKLNFLKTERPPELKLLWEIYLKFLIPASYLEILEETETSSNGLNSFAYFKLEQKLVNLGDFCSKETVISLLRNSPFNILLNKELEKVAERILLLQLEVTNFINGKWHRLIKENPAFALTELNRTLNFTSLWDTALFLYRVGYKYPVSFKSFRSWVRWSNSSQNIDNYFNWFNLITNHFDSYETACEQDFIWERLFLKNSPFFAKVPCYDSPDCFKCPLKASCLYQQKLESKLNPANIMKRLLGGTGASVSIKELIPYLAGERWKQTDTQLELTENYFELAKNKFNNLFFLNNDPDFQAFFIGLTEFARRFEDKSLIQSGSVLRDSKTVYLEMKGKVDQKQEGFYILILDNKHRVIHLQLVTKGILNQSLVHPREVFAPAIQLRAAAIILIHNHPAGDPKPSKEDISITKRLCEVGDLVGIKVLDHIIIGDKTYYSFIDSGTL